MAIHHRQVYALRRPFPELDFQLGLGAGHGFPEYERIGLVFDPPPVRVSRLEESVVVLRRLLDGETVDFQGSHYQLSFRPCPHTQFLPARCRLLSRPGIDPYEGRFAVSDIVLLRPLPPTIANDVAAYVGCVAGASLLSDYLAFALEAGLTDLAIPQITSGSSLLCALVPEDCGCGGSGGLDEAHVTAAAIASVKLHGRRP